VAQEWRNHHHNEDAFSKFENKHAVWAKTKPMPWMNALFFAKFIKQYNLLLVKKTVEHIGGSRLLHMLIFSNLDDSFVFEILWKIEEVKAQ
jgi:hypothetical protein